MVLNDVGGQTQHGVGVVGVEPECARVAFEPRHLLLGIDAGVAFYLLDSLVERPLAVEVGEQFAVAHRLQGVEVAVGQGAAGLVGQAVGHHLIDAAGNAGEEVLAVALQSDAQDVEVVNDVIYNELCLGIVSEISKEKYIQIICLDNYKKLENNKWNIK